MEFSARQIAELLDGELIGDDQVKVNRLAKIEEGETHALSFLDNPQYTEYIYSTGASIVIVNASFTAEKPLPKTCTLIKVGNARESFAKLLEVYNRAQYDREGVEEMCHISKTATIGQGTYIGAFSYIDENAVIEEGAKIFPNCYVGKNAIIGKNTLLHPGTKVYNDCKIGKNCILHAGVVIGGDGFGFVPGNDQRQKKVAQIGNVIIEDHVEIGANTTIDRATMGSTIIREGVKIDNLIQIAHNVEIGENTVIAAQTGIAGSTKVGKDCMIGGQVGIVGHLTIGNGVKIAAQSGIGANLQDNEVVQGSPAFSIRDYKRTYVVFKKLPSLDSKVDQLSSELNKLKSKTEN